MPHHHVLEALRKLGVCDTALKCFASFFSGRTQQVRVGSSLSTTCDVTSGILQWSIIGSILYTILTDPLLRQLSLLSVAFADDVKFLADVTELSKDDVQAEVDIIANWSEEHYMPLSVDKTITLHGDHRQPMHEYSIHRTTIKSVVSFKDLGVLHTAVGYSGHCDNLVAKASQVAAIRRVFHYKSSELMWPAYQIHVIPKIMYLSQAWNPWLRRKINALEKLQVYKDHS